MNKIYKDDIIVAQATPYGKSAIAVIRVSGNGSIELVGSFLTHFVEIGRLKLNKFKTDEFTEHLMAIGFKAPNSYSGEDTVELYPHGNPVICEKIINALIKSGARIAERGEFTKRAFLNGKLDLMQCEALADIIDAQTTEQLEYGNSRFDIGFKALKKEEQLLRNALSSIEAVLHYSDELEENEIETNLMNDVIKAVDDSEILLETEVNGFAGGKIINDGFKVALIGAPNVGKSTLLNILTDSERAIVTPIAGTTRDTIDSSYVYNGRKFIITDTAGINEDTDDEVEKIGISRAYDAANSADAVVFLIDSNKKPSISSVNIQKSLTVKNKCDDVIDVGIDYKKAQKENILQISAKCNVNITALKQMLFDICPKDFGSVCNHRQYNCVLRCIDSLKQAKEEMKKAGGLELVAALLYEAYTAISELHGEKADENIISAVFERFCVGK